ncbi:MAG: alpha/beta hydrolase [Chloroflexi bacterium]|nr:alpha/beta hydrolase [Chloroflexota bacterium]
MPTAYINGIEVYYDLDDFTDPWRQPGTFLLQHGFSRNSRFWYKWLPLLSSQFRVLRPDMRGFGRSSMPPDQFEPAADAYVNDLISLLDHLDIEKVVYVGESFGGILGLLFAHTHPERLEALVLTSTPVSLPGRALEAKFPVKEGSADAALAKGVDNWSRQTIGQRIDLRLAPPQLAEWWIMEMGKTIPENAIKHHRYAATLDFSPHLGELRVPTLVLCGENSPIAGDQVELMRSRVPGVKVVSFPGVGHGVHALMPEQCIQEILTFLNERSLVPVSS